MTTPLRDHDQEMAWTQQEADIETARLAAERAHELQMVEAKREVDLVRAEAAKDQARMTLEYDQKQQRRWSLGRMILIFILTIGYATMIMGTQVAAFVVKDIASELAQFVTLINLFGMIAVPAAAVLYLQGYNEARKGKAPTEDKAE